MKVRSLYHWTHIRKINILFIPNYILIFLQENIVEIFIRARKMPMYKRLFQFDDHKNIIKEYLIKIITVGKIEITIFKE